MIELKKDKIYAVVGVSSNKEKYGYKVWKVLKEKGFVVYGVNVKGYEVEGEKLYESLSSLPQIPDVVVFVVPPKAALEVMKEALNMGVKEFWFQPGSESDEAKEFCKRYNVNCSFNLCIVVDGLKEKFETFGLI